MPTTPNDPLYPSQWHFSLLGDIETIWDEYTGSGVHVGIFDSGVDYNHEDLAGNYDPSLHVVDDNGVVLDPFPVGDDAHGTAVAGIIAGVGNNGLGGTGVAFGASITGVNIFNPALYGYINSGDDTAIEFVLSQANQFDVMSNSWGRTPVYGSYQSLIGSNDTVGRVAAYESVASTGRGGLGTVINQAAGNDNLNSNGDGVNASRFTNTIAATDANGDAQYYSNWGSGILIAAPAAAVTSDISGAPGYDPGDYTTGFGGTSAATPVVSGVVSLMLEANSDLGWRDVQNILANSASLTGSAFGSATPGAEEEGVWFSSTAGNWNGGGHTSHVNYGYGMVNAYAAVRMAEVWTHMTGGSATSANEQHVLQSSGTLNLALADLSTTSDTQVVGFDIEVETVMVTINIQHTWASDLEIWLVAPDGTRYMLMYREGGSSLMDSGFEWVFEVTGARGMSSAGSWTLEIIDQAGADVGTLYDWQLDFYGSGSSANDIHTFTDDFLTVAAVEPGRTTITDTNGGIDWLNFAAVAGGVDVSLAGGTLEVGGVAWGTVTGDVFENAVGGDGNDTIAGSSAANELLGMRGDDSIYGDDGNDTIDGGTGSDTLDGGAGDDTVDGGEGADSIYGNTGNDSILGGNGNDTIGGGAGNDYIAGQGDNDSLLGGGGNDTVYGGGGDDTLDGGNGADTVYGNAGADSILGGDGSDSLNGGSENDTLNGGTGADTLVGDSGNDSLLGGDDDDVLDGGINNDYLAGEGGNDSLVGGGNADRLYGGAGDDTLLGGTGYDTLAGGAGNDLLDGGDHIDYLSGGDGNDTADGGSGNDRVYGDAGDDSLNGGDGDDLVSGGDGSDTVYGDNGNDTMFGDAGNDSLYGGNDNDVIDGGANNDYILGQGGDDSLFGGNNADRIYGGNGNDTLDGSTGYDTLAGGAGDDLLYGGDHIDYLSGGTGNDTLDGGTGTDRLYGEDGTDALYGGADSDTLDGGTGNDLLYGGSGDDTMYGGANGDTLYGQSGNDTLDGGRGWDRMSGGAGADVFLFSEINAGENDTITDFADGVDLIEMVGVSFGDLTITAAGGNTEIEVDGHMITLFGVSAASLTAADFVFS